MNLEFWNMVKEGENIKKAPTLEPTRIYPRKYADTQHLGANLSSFLG